MQETIVSQVAVEVAKKKPTEAEVALIQQLTKSGAEIDVLVPDAIEAKDFDLALSAVCKVIVRSELQKEALLPVLGRLLFVAKQYPTVYQGKYEKYTDFLESLSSRFGVGLSTAYEAKIFAERWSKTIDVDTFKRIGRVGMKILNKAVDKGNEGSAKAVKLIEKASEMPVKEFEAHCVKQGYLDSGQTQGTFLKVGCNKSQLKQIEKFFKNEELQAYLETGDRAAMLIKAIEESTSTWEPMIEEYKRTHGGETETAKSDAA